MAPNGLYFVFVVSGQVVEMAGVVDEAVAAPSRCRRRSTE